MDNLTTLFAVLLLMVQLAGCTNPYLPKSDIAQWHQTYAQSCSGKSQSPINIEEYETKFNKSLALSKSTLNFTFPNEQSEWEMSNTGNYLEITTGQDVVSFKIFGLPETFQLASIHFHWGRNADDGSEHTLNGNAHAMEMHIVGFSTAYASLNDAKASGKLGAVGVLGVLIRPGEENDLFEEVVGDIARIAHSPNGAVEKIAALDLDDLLPDDNLNGVAEFFRYNGSLTTPNCNEIVIWSVFRKPIEMSHKQLAEFRKMVFLNPPGVTGTHYMLDNHRPTQPLHGRKVESSFNYWRK